MNSDFLFLVYVPYSIELNSTMKVEHYNAFLNDKLCHFGYLNNLEQCLK